MRYFRGYSYVYRSAITRFRLIEFAPEEDALQLLRLPVGRDIFTQLLRPIIHGTVHFFATTGTIAPRLGVMILTQNEPMVPYAWFPLGVSPNDDFVRDYPIVFWPQIFHEGGILNIDLPLFPIVFRHVLVPLIPTIPLLPTNPIDTLLDYPQPDHVIFNRRTFNQYFGHGIESLHDLIFSALNACDLLAMVRLFPSQDAAVANEIGIMILTAIPGGLIPLVFVGNGGRVLNPDLPPMLEANPFIVQMRPDITRLARDIDDALMGEMRLDEVGEDELYHNNDTDQDVPHNMGFYPIHPIALAGMWMLRGVDF